MDIITGDREDLIEMLNTASKQSKKLKSKTDKMSFFNYVGNLYGAINLNSYEEYPIDYETCFQNKKNFYKFLKETNIMAKHFGEHFIKYKNFHNNYLYGVLQFYEDKMQKLAGIPECADSKYLGEEKFFNILCGFLSKYRLEEQFRCFMAKKRVFSKIKKHPNDDFLGITLMNPIDKDIAVLIANADYDFDTLFTLLHEFGHVVDLSMFNIDIPRKSFDYAYKSYYSEVYPKLLEKLFIHYLVDEGIVKEIGIDKYIDCMIINHDFLVSTYMCSLVDDKYFCGPEGFVISDEELYNQVIKYFRSEDFVKEFIKEGNMSLGGDIVYTYGDIMSTHLIEPVLADGLSCMEMRKFMDIRVDEFNPEFLMKNGYGLSNYQKVFSKEVDLCKK